MVLALPYISNSLSAGLMVILLLPFGFLLFLLYYNSRPFQLTFLSWFSLISFNFLLTQQLRGLTCMLFWFCFEKRDCCSQGFWPTVF